MSDGKWLVYLLECADQSFYCGATNDLERRLKQHNSGRGSKYCLTRLPVVCVYSEPAKNKSAALKREYAIKQLSRAQKLALIKENAQ